MVSDHVVAYFGARWVLDLDVVDGSVKSGWDLCDDQLICFVALCVVDVDLTLISREVDSFQFNISLLNVQRPGRNSSSDCISKRVNVDHILLVLDVNELILLICSKVTD